MLRPAVVAITLQDDESLIVPDGRVRHRVQPAIAARIVSAISNPVQDAIGAGAVDAVEPPYCGH